MIQPLTAIDYRTRTAQEKELDAPFNFRPCAAHRFFGSLLGPYLTEYHRLASPSLITEPALLTDQKQESAMSPPSSSVPRPTAQAQRALPKNTILTEAG